MITFGSATTRRWRLVDQWGMGRGEEWLQGRDETQSFHVFRSQAVFDLVKKVLIWSFSFTHVMVQSSSSYER